MTVAGESREVVTSPSVGAAVARIWRPYQYLGTKTRALGDIGRAIEDNSSDGDFVADLFTGSTVVAQLAANLGRRVLAADTSAGAATAARAVLGHRREDGGAEIEYLADMVHATALPLQERLEETWHSWLRLEDAAVASSDSEALMRLASDLPQRWKDARATPPQQRVFRLVADGAEMGDWALGALSSTYAGSYFGLRQAVVLDAYRSAVIELLAQEKLSSWAADVAICGLLHCASTATFSAGKHFAQPHKLHGGKDLAFHRGRILQDRSVSVPSVFDRALKEISDAAERPRGGNMVVQRDVVELDSSDYEASRVKVAYLDPPYTAQQYSRFYHVLDVIASGVAPNLQTVRGRVTTGLYPDNKYKSPFCSARQAAPALQRVLSQCRMAGVTAILSYSSSASGSTGNPRMIGLKSIIDVATALYGEKNVTVRAQEFEYRQFNHNSLGNALRADGEVLVVARVAS